MQPTMVISLELELAWGLNNDLGEADLARHSPKREVETRRLEDLLALCDELEVPISFDIVGHLLLEQCSGEHDGPHESDWFGNDPGTDCERDPLYYAPDLVRKIQESEVDHEICTHTFSHVYCKDAEPDVIDWEFEQVRELHEEYGLEPPRSFVPPIHAPCPPSHLHDHNIDGVRTPVEYRAPVSEPTPPNDILNFIPWWISRQYPVEVLFRSHPVREPKEINGLVKHYTTWHASLTAPFLPNGQSEPHQAFRAIPQSLRQSIHRRYLSQGLKRAISENSCAHFWSHLFNLSNEVQWQPIQSFLKQVATKRDRGVVTVSTMAALTQQVIQNNG